ncbi:MAG: magnesium transporter [Planctomycetes bacterium]|nr:magnesium transporter [Planctomycetota bacterium]
MPHALFSPEVKYLLHENNAAGMKEFCETLHPATVAEALATDLPADLVWRFLRHTHIKNQAAIFEYFPIEWQVQLVEGTGREHMAELIKEMSHDDRVDLLRRLMPRVAESLLRLVDEADRRDIATLVRQEENTAGALMTTDYAWLPPNLTASEALDRLRLQAPESETIYYIFILDEQRRLLGVLSLRDLILAARHALIRDLMEEQVLSVRSDDDPEKVAKTMAQFDLIAIPVVDDQGRMVGIITHDDVIDVVVQEATEDAHRMGAVGPMAENYLTADFVTVWRKRAFWLSCLFVAELFTFTALSHFDEAINQVVVLALFVPLCISTGGNSGSQAATLITRAMALGQVTISDWLRVLRHEVLMGLVLGLTLGTIGFVRGAFTPEDVRGNMEKRHDEFQIKVPIEHAAQIDIQIEDERNMLHLRTGNQFSRIYFPKQCLDVKTLDDPVQVLLPVGKGAKVEDEKHYRVYTLPAGSKVRSAAVDRWNLAWVIGRVPLWRRSST